MKVQLQPFANPREVYVTIQARGIELTDSSRLAIRRMVASALQRFAKRVRSIRVWLEDVNGPRGGVDTRCRIEVRLSPHGTVTASGLALDEYAATANAATRVRELVGRHFKRMRATRRRSLLPI